MSFVHLRNSFSSFGWLLLSALAAGCIDDLPGKPLEENRPVAANKVVNFKALFAANCAGCHGAEGEFGPAPPLNDPIFLSIVPDETLLRVVNEGRQGTLMPAFNEKQGGPLTTEQVKILAQGLKSELNRDKSAKLPANIPAYTISKTKPTVDAIARGEKLFASACASCHGEHGKPEASAGPLNDPAFLELISDQALRRVIITGREDLVMPNFADDQGRSDGFRPLTSAEIDDLVALLASWRKPSVVLANPPSPKREEKR